MGDMLFMHPRSLHLRRAQGTLVTDTEVRARGDFLKEQCPAPEYQDLLEQQRKGFGTRWRRTTSTTTRSGVVLTSRLGSASIAPSADEASVHAAASAP